MIWMIECSNFVIFEGERQRQKLLRLLRQELASGYLHHGRGWEEALCLFQSVGSNERIVFPIKAASCKQVLHIHCYYKCVLSNNYITFGYSLHLTFPRAVTGNGALLDTYFTRIYRGSFNRRLYTEATQK